MAQDDRWTCTSVPYLIPVAEGEPDEWTKRGGRQRLVEVVETTPPFEVAEAFGMTEGERAVMRRRLLLEGGESVEIAESWWPSAIAAGTPLAEPRKIKGGAVTYLADVGYTVESFAEELWADEAVGVTATLLNLAPGAPVLTLFRRAYGGTSAPFQVDVETFVPGRRQRYRLTVT